MPRFYLKQAVVVEERDPVTHEVYPVTFKAGRIGPAFINRIRRELGGKVDELIESEPEPWEE